MSHPWGGQPPQWQPWPPPQGQWGPPQPPNPPPKGKRRTVLWIVLALVLTPVAVVTATIGYSVWALQGESGEKRRAENPEVAKFASQFSRLCEDGSVSNAAPYAKPYVIVAFHFSTGMVDGWSQVGLDDTKDYVGNDGAVEKINVVACLVRKPDSEVKSGTCKYTSAGSPKTVDRYVPEYDVRLREAKSGKDVRSLGTVRGSDTCPLFAEFNRLMPKVLTDPDPKAVQAKLADFARS